MSRDLLNHQIEFTNARIAYALATVVEISGSSSAKPGAKALFDTNGQVIFGWVGGGCAQAMVSRSALNCLEDGEHVWLRLI